LCIEQESDNEHIFRYAETKEVILNKEKHDFADTENVIHDKEKMVFADRKRYMIKRNWIVQGG
jgi:hypothetical protein